jgi:adenylosuccinate synthase
MLLDVLTGIDELKICVKYRLNNEEIDYIPADYNDYKKCEPIYITLPGWKEDISKTTRFEDLPVNCRNYLKTIENLLQTKVAIISVGPDRSQTVTLKNIF